MTVTHATDSTMCPVKIAVIPRIQNDISGPNYKNYDTKLKDTNVN